MRYIKVAVLAIAAVLIAGVLAQPVRADISFDLAYSSLSHHGSWLVSAQYGHVWQPSVYSRDWNPYYDGHWVYTDLGWTWVSDYEWGAIPYHYGTWIADPDAGWVWIPGSVWAPAWVVFRTGPDYIGWAPVPPGFSVGMSIDIGGPSSFVFVSSRDFLAPRVRTSVLSLDRVSVIISGTTVVNNIVVQNNVVINRGPDVTIVERATGHTVRRERIESVTRVAPFEHVSRAQLAVDPGRVKQGLRVADPVPASRPLPSADNRGNDKRSNSPAEASQPTNRREADRSRSGEPTTPAAAVTPKPSADSTRKARRDETAPRDTSTASSTEAKSKRSTQQRTSDQAAVDAQKARRDEKAAAPRAATTAPTTAAKTKQSAPQDAKAKARAKAKADADARAKKDQEKKDQSSDKGTEKPNEGNHP